jgi:hypothetical protein
MNIKLPELEVYHIVHTKSGLFFNGYDKNHNSLKGKNTLSITNYEKFFSIKNEEKVILKKAF